MNEATYKPIFIRSRKYQLTCVSRWRCGYLVLSMSLVLLLSLLSLISSVLVWVVQVSVVLVARWTRANCQTVALHHCSALPAPHGACAAPAPRPSTELRRFSRTRTKKRPGTGTAAAPGGAYVLGPVPRHTSRVGPAVTRSRCHGDVTSRPGIFAVRRYSGAADDPATAARPSHC